MMYPGCGSRMIEGRREQAHQPVALAHQTLLGRFHRAPRASGIGRPGNDRPGLRHRIDLRLRIGVRSERRAVVEESAQIPFAVPAGSFHRFRHGSGAFPPGRGDCRLPLLHHVRKGLQHRAQEPAKPDAFAATLDAHAVHAVVPIAVAEQGQLMRAKLPRFIESAPAVFPERRGLRGDGRNEHPLLLAGFEQRTLHERNLFVENARVSGRLYIVRRPRRAARPDRRNSGFALPCRSRNATSAGRRLRGTGAPPTPECAPWRVPARRTPEPSNPATDRENRMRRWIDTARSAPRSGSSAFDKGASD